MFEFRKLGVEPPPTGENEQNNGLKQTTKKRKISKSKILQLPYDCLKEIVDFLKIKKVFNAFLTCKTFYRLLYDRNDSYISTWLSMRKNKLLKIIVDMLLEKNFKKPLRIYGRDIQHSFELLRTSLQRFALDNIAGTIEKLERQFKKNKALNVEQAMQYILYVHIINNIKNIDAKWLELALDTIEAYQKKYLEIHACKIYLYYSDSLIQPYESTSNPHLAFRLDNNGGLLYRYIDKNGKIAHTQKSNKIEEWIVCNKKGKHIDVIISALQQPLFFNNLPNDGYKILILKPYINGIVKEFTNNQEYSCNTIEKVFKFLTLCTLNILNLSQVSKICADDNQTYENSVVKYLELIDANNKEIKELWGVDKSKSKQIFTNASGLQLKNIRANIAIKLKDMDLSNAEINNVGCCKTFTIDKSYIENTKISNICSVETHINESYLKNTSLRVIDRLNLVGSELSQVTFNKSVYIVNFYVNIKNLNLQSANVFSLEAMTHLLLYVKTSKKCFNGLFPKALKIFLQKASRSSVNKFVTTCLKSDKLKYESREEIKDYIFGTFDFKKLIEKLCIYVNKKPVQDSLRNNINKLIVMHNENTKDKKLKCVKLPLILTPNQRNQQRWNNLNGIFSNSISRIQQCNQQHNRQQTNSFLPFSNHQPNNRVIGRFQPLLPPPPPPSGNNIQNQQNNIHRGTFYNPNNNTKKILKKKKAPKKVYQQPKQDRNNYQQQQLIFNQHIFQTFNNDNNLFFNQQQQYKVDNQQPQGQKFNLSDDCFNLDYNTDGFNYF
ncbi:MAG: hypothetical protein PVI75_07380 [Gammaproteobacteria bacterium]|jgi:hypothetical protein